MPETVILDLDGTVLSVNSFRLWALHLVHARFSRLGRPRRWIVSARTVKALVARKMGFISHETLKWRLQKIWRSATKGDRGAGEQDFAASLLPFVRPELNALLAAIADGKIDAVLATAAVGDYAYTLGQMLGFTNVLATPRLREAGEPSNVGVRKRDAVIDLIVERGWQDRPLVLFTDHADDLPLIRISPTVFWFGSEAERRILATLLPQISLHTGFPGDDLFHKQSA